MNTTWKEYCVIGIKRIGIGTSAFILGFMVMLYADHRANGSPADEIINIPTTSPHPEYAPLDDHLGHDAELTEAADEQIQCMALNIYHEARGEDFLGQAAVAHVTMNRVNHEYFPNTVCDVVWQRSQFSWTHDGRSDTPHDQAAYDIAYTIAHDVFFGLEENDPTNGALFYHATWVSPTWAQHENLTISLRHGVHIFYNWTGSWN